jgi:protein involved in polysaccharide export with SLBB domain
VRSFLREGFARLPLFSYREAELKTTLCLLAIAMLLAGCGGLQPKPEVSPEAPAVIKLPERAPYRLGLGDKLEIRFPYYKDYNTLATVRPDGAITVPQVGEIVVEGMTPLELEGIIRARFAQLVAHPEVSVLVTDASGLRVFIFGEVRMAGARDLTGSMTLLDAIAEAGGVTYLAKQDDIVLIRRSPEGAFVGSKHNLEKIIDGRAENPYLMGRDVIYVPMSAIGKVDVFVDQFFEQITPVWDFYIRGREAVDPKRQYIFGD